MAGHSVFCVMSVGISISFYGVSTPPCTSIGLLHSASLTCNSGFIEEILRQRFSQERKSDLQRQFY